MRAVFFDRDGVVNVWPGEAKFVTCWDEFHFMPGVREQLRRLRQADFKLIVISNQSGVGRGLMTLAALEDVHTRMQRELGAEAFDAIYFCPHHPTAGCACRKPAPEMILRACARFALKPAECFMLGDSGRDIEMGCAAGCRTILCRASLPQPQTLASARVPDKICNTLSMAVDWILQAATAAPRK